ncbi:alpha/beta fold hydrolase [Massilia sp. 9096]|uniref:alpha/beta fold hydrolase n=1 Tax=Massilia sp. 9096 TaxID=1500894 RepID=UPI0018CF357E|nr:alpha/beta hydrolase [Massilia sp. 9096]
MGTLLSLASLAMLVGGVYLVWAWFAGMLVATSSLVYGLVMVAWSLLGRQIVLAFYPHGRDKPHAVAGNGVQSLQAADGSSLHLEFDGPPDGPVIILTHGWALDSAAWYSVRRELAKTYRLVLWDLPGLGKSSQPADRHYSVARLAEDLRTVILATGDKPVTLVGHSIGGFMMLTLARLHPELLQHKVRGMVLMDTTHTWPLRTVMAGGLLRLLRWPLIEPLLLLTILLWPLMWLSNLQSYLNGTSHIVNRLTSLSRGVTREQLDFASRYNIKDHPGVIAKGLRAVLRWDETETPRTLTVPVRVLAGDADRITKPEAGIAISRMAPDADFVSIAPAGHNGLIEAGEKYAAAIAEFMQKTAVQRQPGGAPTSAA